MCVCVLQYVCKCHEQVAMYVHVGGTRQISGHCTATQGLLQWNGRYSTCLMTHAVNVHVLLFTFHTGHVPDELPKIGRMPLIEV